MQLGLLDDAVRLYRECGRYDLLNRLYQAAGLWERALEVAEAKDGINLSTTHQLYAQHLEKVSGCQTEVSLQFSTTNRGTLRSRQKGFCTKGKHFFRANINVFIR